MTDKFEAFKAALEKLCTEHCVTLDSGYENISVWSNPVNPKSDPDTYDLYLIDETDWWENNGYYYRGNA